MIRAFRKKTPGKVVDSLTRISEENGIAKLREIIQEFRESPILHTEPPANVAGTSAASFITAVQYLKDIYKTDCEIMKKHWQKLNAKYPEDFELDDMFIDLEIIRKGRRQKDKIESDKYEGLFGFRNGKRYYKKIVLEGSPGMGKTTYLHRLVQTWADDKDEKKKKITNG